MSESPTVSVIPSMLIERIDSQAVTATTARYAKQSPEALRPATKAIGREAQVA